MANNNPNGGAGFWFEGGPSSVIDNGSTDASKPWIGTTNFWYNGTSQGFLQGGPGNIGDSPQNLKLLPIIPPVDVRAVKASAVIL
jgi:hypothetical protein